MNIQEARELAGRAWCDPKTSNREMDVELANVFAAMLVDTFAAGRAYQSGKDVGALERIRVFTYKFWNGVDVERCQVVRLDEAVAAIAALESK